MNGFPPGAHFSEVGDKLEVHVETNEAGYRKVAFQQTQYVGKRMVEVHLKAHLEVRK